MTDQEKIDLLGEALNNLMQSADAYIVDGTWIDELTLDIETARALLKRMPPKSWNVEVCFYCEGNCPNDEDHACDGYLGDIDGLYSEAK